VFKRLFWLTVGVIAGSWLSFRLRRRVHETVNRLLPDRVAADVSSRVRGLASDVKNAAREGKETMKQREASLRSEMIEK
jgi:hypothetical protein